MKPDDEIFLFFSYVASLDIRPKIVKPTKATTLSTAFEAYFDKSITFIPVMNNSAAI